MSAPIKIALVIALAISGGSFIQAVQVRDCDQLSDDYGLLKRIHPTIYQLDMNVRSTDLTYNVSTIIWITVEDSEETKNEPKNMIVVHADNSLAIKDVRYIWRKTEVADVCRDRERQLLIVRLVEDMRDGTRGKLLVDVEASIRDDGRGLFKSTGVGSFDSKSVVKAHFRHTNARLIFPCIDVAELKTVFDLRIWHDYHVEIRSSTFGVDEKDLKTRYDDLTMTILYPSKPISIDQVEFEVRRI